MRIKVKTNSAKMSKFEIEYYKTMSSHAQI